MNSEKKEQIIKAFLSLAAIGTAVAFTPALAAGGIFGGIKALFSSLAPNWAAQFSVEALMPWVKRKWLKDPNPSINHHINTALVLSWKEALDQVLEEYTDKKQGLQGKEAQSLPAFIYMLKEISVDEFLRRLNEDLDQEEIFKYLSPNNEQIKNYLDKRFALKDKLDPFSDEYYLTQDFIEFFQERVPALMSFYFRADLKKGKEAKHAMDLLYSETIRESVNQVSKRQEEQLRILTAIDEKVDGIGKFDAFEISSIKAGIENFSEKIIQEINALRKEMTEKINELKVKPLLYYNDESKEPDQSTLFSYKQKYTTFTGREKELNLLERFIDDKRGFCWVALSGPGGIGKSRLALEITETARTETFHSGFLDISKSFNWEMWSPSIATFIVIDYAFSDYEKIFDLIEILREKDNQKELKYKVRILLLDRDLRVDFKRELITNDAVRNSNFLMNSPEKFCELKPLENAQRWQIIKELINKSELQPGKKLELLGQEQQIIEKLNELDDKKRPLFAFFTGMALLQEGGLKDIESWNADDLIEHHLIRLEDKVWKKSDRYKSDPLLIKKLIVINTLCRELTPAEITKAALKLGIDSRFIKEEYFLFIETRKNAEGDVERYYGIQPDILGEYFILMAINEISSTVVLANETWLDLYQFSIELRAKNVTQELQLIAKDFNILNLVNLKEIAKERIAEYNRLIKDNPSNYFYYAERGGQKYILEQYEDALLDFSQSILINSLNNISYFWRGLAHWQLKHFHEAIIDFNTAIQLYPDWEEPYFNKGYQLYELDQYEEAINYFIKAIDLNNKYFEGYANKANAEFQLEKYERAIEDYDKAIELKPDTHTYYYGRAYAKIMLDQCAEAIKDYDKAIQLSPENAMCYSGRGNAKRIMGRFEDAIKDYDKAIQLNPDNSVVYNGRGDAKIMLSRYEGAIEDYTSAIKLKPDNSDYYYKRGESKYSISMYAGAIDDFSEAIKLDNNNSHYYVNRGLANRRVGNYDDAIDDYDKAAEINPTDATTYLNRGIAKYLSNKYNFEGIALDLDKAVELGKSGGKYFERALIKSYFEKYEEAIEDYTSATELEPDNPDYYYKRGESKDSLGMYHEAIDDFSKAIKLDNNNSHYYLNRGLANRRLGNYHDAINDYDKAAEINPTDATIYLNRGIAKYLSNKYNFDDIALDLDKAVELEKSGGKYFERALIKSYFEKYEEAIEDYTSATELEPDNPNYYYKRGESKNSLGMYHEAIDDFSEAIKLNNNDYRYYLTRGLAKYFSNKYDFEEIVLDLDKTIELKKSSGNYFERALIKNSFGKYEEAIDDYSNAIELKPDNPNYYYKRGQSKHSLGMHREAIDDYSKAIKLDNNNSHYYVNRGLANRRLRNYDDAINDYDKAAEINSTDATIYLNRGIAKYLSNKYNFEDIALDLDKAVELEKSGSKYYERALIKSYFEKYEEAIEDYTSATELEPDNPDYYYERGHSRDALGRYDEAIKDYSKAIEFVSNYSGYYGSRANSNRLLGNCEQAIEDYDKAIELEPRNPDYYYVRGYVNDLLGKNDQAIKDYDKAIELDPVNSQYYNGRGYSKNSLEKYEQAIADFNMAAQIEPNFPNPYKHRAFARFNLKEFNTALIDINIAINLNNNYKEAFNLRGEIYISLGKKDLACEDFKKAWELDDEDGKKNFYIHCADHQ